MNYSIILPVRNGGKFVKHCVESILLQSFRDFELLILENCSSDNTLEQIASFSDSRIKLYPTDTSLSIEDNWHRALTVPKNEFMTLIGHDDVLDKDYLLIMNDLIRKHQEASLYQTHFRYVDSDGNVIGKCQPMTEVQKPAEVIHNFLCNKTDMMGTGFMMRSKDYDNVGGISSYPNLLFADMKLWIELSRKSFLAVDNRECFAYRKHPMATTSTSSDAKFLNAFGLLVNYLYNLRNTDFALASTISTDSSCLLKQYCQGITHKVLRTPKNKRQTPGVADIIDQFREYGKKLGNYDFEPLNFKNIQMGKVIDKNFILHTLFLVFKKIYNKPIIKK